MCPLSSLRFGCVLVGFILHLYEDFVIPKALGIEKDMFITSCYIVMKDPSTGARTNLLRMKAAGIVGVYHPLIDEKLVRILRGRNKKVYAWTVDDEASMERMLVERVDAMVTGNPTLLQRLMQDIRTQCLEEGFSLS
ncbi:Glycerophosphodiester phosphodiesterase GDPD4 [Vitis vinifera]|uniref:glycerophosphodiester phosphodiesterase n=1 Tax=Vitis vinifera TaxID=29760 RepID=A0A438CLN4_VITVI|nr:Glycerophosphodiester phosphodiesterase GDPD4 [Vitis vinifera]